MGLSRRFGGRWSRYGTITIMCVLVVYDGWSHLKLLGVLGVVVGPIVAMFVSHVSASSPAQRRAGGRSTDSPISVFPRPSALL
jgi:hypothetical protein